MEHPMSLFFATKSLADAEGREAAVGTISSLISRAVDGIVTRMREKRTRHELMQLDDHMLKDLGVSRIELNRISWSAKGHPSGM
jgi:uncharacterized protein YjiS (DUF1127 family)